MGDWEEIEIETTQYVLYWACVWVNGREWGRFFFSLFIYFFFFVSFLWLHWLTDIYISYCVASRHINAGRIWKERLVDVWAVIRDGNRNGSNGVSWWTCNKILIARKYINIQNTMIKQTTTIHRTHLTSDTEMKSCASLEPGTKIIYFYTEIKKNCYGRLRLMVTIRIPFFPFFFILYFGLCFII